jgi:hypothetical protein
MTKTNNSDRPSETTSETKPANERRALLKKLGRFAAVTAPTVTLLLAARTKPAKALPVSGAISSRQLKDRVGPVDDVALSSALASVGDGAAINLIDGVGVCLAAIKALSQKVESLDAQLQATH